MEIQKSLAIIKALADVSRLRIIKALSAKPCYVEELAKRLDLADSTVSFHLKKLSAVGLVTCSKQQYYYMYSLDDALFNLKLKEILAAEDLEEQTQSERIVAYKEKTIRTFFKGGSLQALPVQHKKRLIILEEFRLLFKSGKIYSENEVNEIIRPVFADYCTIRRLLIEEGWMERNNSMYQLTGKNNNG